MRMSWTFPSRLASSSDTGFNSSGRDPALKMRYDDDLLGLLTVSLICSGFAINLDVEGLKAEPQ